MMKTYLLAGLVGVLCATSCGQGSAPVALGAPVVQTLAKKPVPPTPPPKPPAPPTAPGTGSNDVSVQCVRDDDADTTTCTISINGKTQVRTYPGQVSTQVTTGQDGKAVVQILQDGQVIDTITG